MRIEARSGEFEASTETVSPTYFDLVGARLSAGRSYLEVEPPSYACCLGLSLAIAASSVLKPIHGSPCRRRSRMEGAQFNRRSSTLLCSHPELTKCRMPYGGRYCILEAVCYRNVAGWGVCRVPALTPSEQC